ncbi:predicted protein [Lichtheimia corymbifera JMRC:FSU:9682]|uniref:OTU domain-containing protein n=1 Tax=Lichtheimia corymbifera JMRC:FSU:9682 TaxID=1263082 RepID=A0A068SI29_9FUNG|nr:predicted protein [Lichtheimia corymbifera JMRC:FSU:9682]
MLETAQANSHIYKKYTLYHSEQEYERLVRTLEFGLTPETKDAHLDFCPQKYWFDGSTMAQVAADAFGRPVAVFETCSQHPSPPRFVLPFSPPVENPKPTPMILHLVGAHYYSLVIKPSIRVEWPSVPHYHQQAWRELEIPAHYKTTWRYLHIRKPKPTQKIYYPDIH